MIVTSQRRRTFLQVLILLVMVADLVLVGVNWKLSLSPSTTGEELRALQRERELMALDLKNAQSIRRDLPATHEHVGDDDQDSERVHIGPFTIEHAADPFEDRGQPGLGGLQSGPGR